MLCECRVDSWSRVLRQLKVKEKQSKEEAGSLTVTGFEKQLVK